MDDEYKHPAEERKVRFRPNLIGDRKDNIRWIVMITTASFLLSASLSFISSKIFEDVNNLIAILVVLFIVIIGIVFDIIGIAVTAAVETPFHAMASRKYYGARQAINLIRNANKVSSFCNDVVGDICGVISGTAGALMTARLAGQMGLTDLTFTGLGISGMIASLTVGGKAIGKTFALMHSSFIVYKVSVIIQFIIGRIKFAKGYKKDRKTKDR